MFRLSRLSPTSRLYDQTGFYKAFKRDLRSARRRVIIESPFITRRRCYSLFSLIDKALRVGVEVTINTRNPDEHGPYMEDQARECVIALQELGATVLYTDRLHRKIAIVDDIVWEGSLNVLSQSDSCEIMRRTTSKDYARELTDFIKMAKWYN